LFDTQQLVLYWQQITAWFIENVFVVVNLIELAILVVLYILSLIFYKKLRGSVNKLLKKISGISPLKRRKLIKNLLKPLIFLFLIGIYYIVAMSLNGSLFFSSIVGNLLTAWSVIKLVSIFLPGTIFVRIISFFAWAMAALKILTIYDEAVNLLDSLAFQSGNLRISLLLVVKAAILFTVFLWLAGKVSDLLEKRIETSNSLTPSIKVLINKFLKFSFFTLALLITLSSVGIDITTFAFLGGAIGVGLGFGLQKIVSNFISGIIILLDKSIKPGDVVEISQVYGWIKSLDTRFVSVVTRAGKEYLIPNEDFITKQVINWSYSDELVRVDIPVGVSYGSDLRLVERLLEKALTEKERIVNSPEASCLLKGFGESSVDFELRFWIKDPRNGIANVRSEILFNVWDLFQEHDIEIPFPQRDFHLKSMPSEQLSGFNNYSSLSSEAATTDEDFKPKK